MRIVTTSLFGILVATGAAACFAPVVPENGYPLQVSPDCSFTDAGGSFSWHGGPAYRLENGLIAQSVEALGFCLERQFIGTMIADCDAEKSTVVFDARAGVDVRTANEAFPDLPDYLSPEQKLNYDAILSHPRIEQHDLVAQFMEPDSKAFPNPFCGCALPALFMNEKG